MTGLCRADHNSSGVCDGAIQPIHHDQLGGAVGGLATTESIRQQVSRTVKKIRLIFNMSAKTTFPSVAAVEQQERTLELQRSESLVNQDVEIAQIETNLLTVKIRASAEMAEFNRLREVAATESRLQLEALATAIAALKWSVTSQTCSTQHSSNIVRNFDSSEGS